MIIQYYLIQQNKKDFGNIKFTPLEKTVNEAIKYYEKFGTLGEYTHLKINSENGPKT